MRFSSIYPEDGGGNLLLKCIDDLEEYKGTAISVTGREGP
jgi:hypothetical protein